jgi:hypothetical protein
LSEKCLIVPRTPERNWDNTKISDKDGTRFEDIDKPDITNN